MRPALVVFSGGQDSTFALYWMKPRVLHTLTFDYGQTHRAELDAAELIAGMAGVASHTVVPLGPVFRGTSPLTTGAAPAEYESVEAMRAAVGTAHDPAVVPGRNAVFLSIACAHAAAMGVDTIVTGINDESAETFPDCSAEFLRAMETALSAGVGRRMHLVSPLLHMTKAQSVRWARTVPELWEALAYTHTAFDGKYPPTGRDHASLLRARSFEDAGLPDPLVLRAWREGLMALPNTPNYRGGVR